MDSFLSRTISALEAAIENRASKSMLSLSIGSKAISLMSLDEQLEARERLQAELIRSQLAAKKISPFKTIGIRL